MPASLGALLKTHRSSAGLTQEELAEKAQVSARTVSDVERGLRTRIYRDTAARLAGALSLEGPDRSEFATAARGRRQETALPSRLPIPPTRLIGRDRELEVIVAALDRRDVRLVTLTGPGGIGKTRLGLEAAARKAATDEIFFVQLGTVAEAAEVLPLVAHSLGVSGAREPSVTAVAGHLGATLALLVLDTMEHVLDAAADVAELIAACPGLTVLATSREALRVRGEHEVSIPTLEVADVSSPAVALFIERAVAVRPGLTIDDRSEETIAEICHRVNGLPLAIELAAARAKHFSLEALRDQLEHRLNVLVGGPRDLPRRQRTMRDTIAWSYELLDPDEQELFRDLCVFSGGWTLDAAAFLRRHDVVAGTSALVDKSLVILTDAEEPRYGMLDTVREFGIELRETADIQDRHRAYFMALAEEAEPEIGGATQDAWLARLEREHDNIRAALRQALDRGDADAALRIGGAVWRFWLLHGFLSEGRGWLSAALAAGADAQPKWRAKGLWGSAWLAYHQGDYASADQCGREMLALADASGDPVELRNALTIQGIVTLAYGRSAEAIAPLARCVELLEDRGRSWLLATSLLNLGMAQAHGGDDDATTTLDRAQRMYADLGDRHFEARSVLYSGYAALVDRREQSATDLFRTSLVTFWELDDLWGVTEALEGLAATAGASRMPERGATIAGAAHALRETINTRPFAADSAVMDRNLSLVRGSIEPAVWSASWERGGSMPVEESVGYALSDD